MEQTAFHLQALIVLGLICYLYLSGHLFFVLRGVDFLARSAESGRICLCLCQLYPFLLCGEYSLLERSYCDLRTPG